MIEHGLVTQGANRAERLLSKNELADYLGIPHRTVDEWRRRGRGPRGVRVGKHVRYRLADVDAYLEQNADPEPEAA